MITPTDVELDALVEGLKEINSAYVLTKNEKTKTAARTLQAADAITALRAELATLKADYDDAFARGASYGQQALKDLGVLKIIDSPELAVLRAELAAERAKVEALSLPPPWDDRDDDMTPAIKASHPCNSKDWAAYTEALTLVSNRHGKGALVALVCHLIREAKK